MPLWIKRGFSALIQAEAVFLILSLLAVGMMIVLESASDKNALALHRKIDAAQNSIDDAEINPDHTDGAAAALSSLFSDQYLLGLRHFDSELNSLCGQFAAGGKAVSNARASVLLRNISTRIFQLEIQERSGFRSLSLTCFLLLCFSLTFSIMQYAHSHETLEKLRIENRLSIEKIEMQKSERLQISRDLHDGAAQDLARARLLLQAEHVDREGVTRSVDEAIKEIRWICGSFRIPFDTETPLENLLEGTALAFSSECRLPVNVHIATRRLTQWPPDAKYEITHIIEEGLTNIERHAEASNATLYITEVGSRLHIALDDDGIGLGGSPGGQGIAKPGYGMNGIMERCALLNGRAEWTNRAERGTRLSVDIPLPDKNAEHGEITK